MGLAKMASASTVKTLAQLVVSFIFAFILFRYTATNVVGEYYFWQSLLFFGGLIFGSITGAASYILPKAGKKAVNYIIAASLVILPIAFLVYVVVFAYFGLEHFVWLALISALSNIATFTIASLINSYRAKDYVYVSFATYAVKIIFLLLFIFIFGSLSFWTLIILVLLAQSPALILFVKMLLQVRPSVSDFISSFNKILSHWKAGFFAYSVNVLNSIILISDVFFIGVFFTMEDTGIYNAIGNLVKYAMYAIPGGIAAFVFPMAVKEGKGFLKKAIFFLTLLLLPLVVIAIYPVPFIKVITGGYQDFANITLFFLPALLFVPISAGLMRFFLGRKNYNVLLYLFIVAAVNLVVNYFLAVDADMWLYGIVLASSISAVLFAMLLSYLALKERILDASFVLKYLLQSSLLAVILYAISTHLPLPKTFGDLFAALIYSISAIVVAYILNILLSIAIYNKLFFESFEDVKRLFGRLAGRFFKTPSNN